MRRTDFKHVFQQGHVGFDFWLDDEALWSAKGSYATEIFTNRTTEIIRNQAIDGPDAKVMTVPLSARIGSVK